MITILSNPLYAIGLLLASSITLTLLFTRILKLNKIQLKRLDYWWLTMSAFAIFGLVEKNRLEFNSIETTKMNWQVNADTVLVNMLLDSNRICRHYTRSEYSPDNLEYMQTLTDSLCSSFKEVIIHAKVRMNKRNYIEKLLPLLADEFLQRDAIEINAAIDQYNLSLKRLDELKSASFISEANYTLQLFSPLLLIFGLAIRFSKTATEIRLDKHK